MKFPHSATPRRGFALLIAAASADGFAARKHRIKKRLGATDAGFNRYCVERAVSAACAAFNTLVSVINYCFMILHNENTAGTDFSTPAAPGTFIRV